jgi:hypothetical protein
VGLVDLIVDNALNYWVLLLDMETCPTVGPLPDANFVTRSGKFCQQSLKCMHFGVTSEISVLCPGISTVIKICV